jgi:hypothetical protein
MNPRPDATQRLPAIVGVANVQRRYGIRDPRVARRVMREAGGFIVARRLMVRLDALDAWERGLREGPPAATVARPKPVRRAPVPGAAPGWWKKAS